MRIAEGRKNGPMHYFEANVIDGNGRPRLAVLAQKSGVVWCLYLVWPGRKAPVRTLPTIAHDPETARNAVQLMAETLDAYESGRG
jgi:hypothetical protein